MHIFISLVTLTRCLCPTSDLYKSSKTFHHSKNKVLISQQSRALTMLPATTFAIPHCFRKRTSELLTIFLPNGNTPIFSVLPHGYQRRGNAALKCWPPPSLLLVTSYNVLFVLVTGFLSCHFHSTVSLHASFLHFVC